MKYAFTESQNHQEKTIPKILDHRDTSKDLQNKPKATKSYISTKIW